MAEKIKKTKLKERTSNGRSDQKGRISVTKTYKLYIDGKFPRTESGRFISIVLANRQMVNICRSSRKDLKNAVVAARGALAGWSGRSAYNRSQVLYRIAEMMESRKTQFVEELMQLGERPNDAKIQTNKCVDAIVYYSGWCDKYIQIFSTINPVASSYFNFSIPEPTGVVGIICSDDLGLSGLIEQLMPVLVGGNTAILIVPPRIGTVALDFAEVLATSDVPAGVVNILTATEEELMIHLGSHLDINAVIYAGSSKEQFTKLQQLGAGHVLRVIDRRDAQRRPPGPYQILDTQEIKTTWHPVGK